MALLLISAAHAAPRDVTVTLKTEDGKPYTPPVTFRWFSESDDGIYNSKGLTKDGTATVRLSDGKYALWLAPNKKMRVPGAIWRNLEVKEGAQKWDLTVPLFASVEGRILLADGKPAANYRVFVQSGTWPAYSWLFKQSAISVSLDPAAAVRGAQNAYSSTQTAADGTFTLSDLVPGNFALDVFKPTSNEAFFTIPFAPTLKADAQNGVPTKIGDWKVPENGWNWLFDRKLQHNGVPSKFDGQGEFKADYGVLHLGMGKDLTGVTWDDKMLPRENYEISLDARRAAGSDFFCGLTFPVGDKPLSWIVGGWGGTVVGLSNINGASADENESTRTHDFDLGRWYRLRLRVSKAKIEAWIDGEKVVDMPTADKEFSIRYSVEPSKPLGIATWRTTGEVRDIRIRRLDANEVADIAKTVDQP